MAAGIAETLEDAMGDLGGGNEALRELSDSEGRLPSFFLILALFVSAGGVGAVSVLRGGNLGGSGSGLSNCGDFGRTSIVSCSSSLLDTLIWSWRCKGRLGLELATPSVLLLCPVMRLPEPGAADRVSRVDL